MNLNHHCPECEIDFTYPRCPTCGWTPPDPNPTYEIEFGDVRILVDSRTAIVLREIMAEVIRAREKWPAWPYDKIHAGAIVAEEAGELIQAVVQERYQPEKEADPYMEAIQTAAMCIRFLTGE